MGRGGGGGRHVLLDLQPGRTDFRTQAERYRSLLELPHVGLALDPEWRLGADEVHLRQIGSVGIDEVNGVVTWLADLTREKALPQKLLVLHQFRLAMVDGRDRLDTSRQELAVMVHADGQGAQPRQAGHLAGAPPERARLAGLGMEELLRRGPADAHRGRDPRRGEPAAAADQLSVGAAGDLPNCRPVVCWRRHRPEE